GTFQAGRLRESLVAMQKCTELDPSFIDGLNDFGQAVNRAGRLDEALHSAKRALTMMPNHPTVYYHVGMHLVYLDADSRAERFLAPAAARFPTVPRLQILLSYLDLR